MNTNKLIAGIVAAAIAIIILAGVLMPVLSNATATTDTFTNEGYFYLQKFTSDDDYTISWDAADPNTFTINNEAYTYANDSGLGLSIVLGEKFYLRLQNGNTRISFNNNGSYVNTSETYTTMTLTYTGGTVSATNGNASRSVSDVPEIYGIMPTGDYVMKKSASPAYLNSGSEIIADSEIYASGQSSSGSNNLFWHLEGTIDDIDYPDTFNSNLTVTNETINGDYSTTHEDLYVLNNLTFTVTTSTSVVYNITASYFVVPAEVTAERSVQLDPAMSVILNVIPLLIIVAVLLGVVAIFIIRRE